MDYRDATSLRGGATSSVYPTKDKDDNVLETEYGLSIYEDHQVVTIQEMPEKAPPGQLPRSVDIVCDNDLVHRVKPGDRVQIAGVYRSLAGRVTGMVSGTFRTAVIANYVQPLAKDANRLILSEKDIENITKLAKRKDLFELLGRSVATSICGHPLIKKAICLILVGGAEKNLENGTHIRGDINMMMVGDPSTAKSQLLRSIMNLGPLVINTTGRGSSGVGLTAAVLVDRDSGERRLEAGAMVLADRGIVCIDEFDKMNDADRVAIHEVMEQQTVTIAKAGIHTSLNARCSVIAAANPIYGMYDTSLDPARNIGLPDSLLSRFDLLFLVLDQRDMAVDKKIAEHVVRMHRYRKAVEPKEESQTQNDTKLFEKFDKLLHGGAVSEGSSGDKVEILTSTFLQKYLQYCKNASSPVLKDDAADYIASEYSALRSQEVYKSLPITARSLETLIRLSTAHAKLRLSNVVTKDDCVVAASLLKQALFSDAPDAESKISKGGKMTADGDDSETEGDDDDDDDKPKRKATTSKPTPKKTPQKSPKKARSVEYDPYSFDDDEMTPSATPKKTPTKRASFQTQSHSESMDVDDEPLTTPVKLAKSNASKPIPSPVSSHYTSEPSEPLGNEPSAEVVTFVMKIIVHCFRSRHADVVSFNELFDALVAERPDFTMENLRQVVSHLDALSKVLIHGDKIYRI